MSNKQKHEIMKATAKNIETGMTIQYTGTYQTIDGIGYVSCGSIKKDSPIVKVLSVKHNPQRFSGLNSIMVTTECGLTLRFSTRQSVLVK